MMDGKTPLVILHYPEGSFGFPQVYVSAPGAVILSVDENAPGDRVFRMTNHPIPAPLLASLEGEEIHTLGDDPGKDARAALASAMLRGEAPPGPKPVGGTDEPA